MKDFVCFGLLTMEKSIDELLKSSISLIFYIEMVIWIKGILATFISVRYQSKLCVCMKLASEKVRELGIKTSKYLNFVGIECATKSFPLVNTIHSLSLGVFE